MRKTIIKLVLAALVVFGFIKVIEINERFSCPTVTVVVQPGDTVWGIIKERGCTGNLESARNSVVELLGGSDLQPGQTFTLPGK
jgi:hypothetical protein